MNTAVAFPHEMLRDQTTHRAILSQPAAACYIQICHSLQERRNAAALSPPMKSMSILPSWINIMKIYSIINIIIIQDVLSSLRI